MQNNVIYHKLNGSALPDRVRVIDSPPQQLFYRGETPNEILEQPTVTIVGSRRPTAYGRDVTTKLSRELSQKGVVIISGLALGVDSIAHQACIESGGKTIAVLPCGPDEIYPRSHTRLAENIINSGGAIVTEYPERTPAMKQNFIARNRIVSALGDVIIVTEAAEQSGTLHTANFALNQGKTVMAVPGPITSPLSKGTNNLIKAGALPITDTGDVLHELGLQDSLGTFTASSPEEYVILTLLQQGITDGNELLVASKLATPLFNQTITMLEINGRIRSLGGNIWQLL